MKDNGQKYQYYCFLHSLRARQPAVQNIFVIAQGYASPIEDAGQWFY